MRSHVKWKKGEDLSRFVVRTSGVWSKNLYQIQTIIMTTHYYNPFFILELYISLPVIEIFVFSLSLWWFYRRSNNKGVNHPSLTSNLGEKKLKPTTAPTTQHKISPDDVTPLPSPMAWYLMRRVLFFFAKINKYWASMQKHVYLFPWCMFHKYAKISSKFPLIFGAAEQLFLMCGYFV